MSVTVRDCLHPGLWVVDSYGLSSIVFGKHCSSVWSRLLMTQWRRTMVLKNVVFMLLKHFLNKPSRNINVCKLLMNLVEVHLSKASLLNTCMYADKHFIIQSL